MDTKMEEKVRADLNEEGQVVIVGETGDHVVPGAKTVEGELRLPLSWAAVNMLRGVFGETLEIGESLTAWAKEERERRVDLANRMREATDGPDFKPVEYIERDDTTEGDLQDVESMWWWSIWRGMPEFLNRNLDSWRSIKVHFRGPSDLEEFARRVEQTVTTQTRFIWFPKASEVHFDEWRWVDEDTPTEEYPEGARKPSQAKVRREIEAKKPKPKKEKKVAEPQELGTAPRLRPNPKLRGLK